MGNSGSIHNITTEELNAHHFRHRFGQQHPGGGDHGQLHWSQSFPRELQAKQQPHIKVLPELNEGPRLRTTANGAILHSGGTISGRREVAPPPLLQRSKTSINYDMYRGHDDLAPGRSIGQVYSGGDKENHQHGHASYKKFGSEPDLTRASGDEESGSGNNSKISKSKIIKNKKKKAAPAPPLESQEYNSNRLAWQPQHSQHHPQHLQHSQHSQHLQHLQVPSSKEAGQRKLRLFKTKAESKKTTSQMKLAAEASDLHFSSQSPERNSNLIKGQLVRNGKIIPNDFRMDMKYDRLPEKSNWKDSKIKILPVPLYRREKSFDVSLLSSRSNQTEEVIRNVRERQRSSNHTPTPQLPPESHHTTRQMSAEPDRPVRKSVVETKLRARKLSQPAQAPTFDFKKELEEATKRRSLVVENQENKTIQSNDKNANGKGVDRPVPRARISKTKTKNDVQKKEKIQSQAASKGPVDLNRKKKESKVIANENGLDAKKRTESKIPQLTKTFYFGMEKDKPATKDTATTNNFGKIQMEVIDQFAKSIMTNQKMQRANSESSESALSSEECYQIAGTSGGSCEETNSGGIQVHVRPTLPRRQLEIPRFSPAAAWRMLNDEQKEALAQIVSKPNVYQVSNEYLETRPQPVEERIQRIYREPIPGYPDNKSGDSGISGDAGLPERPESPRRFNNDAEAENPEKVGPFLQPWTPQQDLEEDTSSDGEAPKQDDIQKFPTRGHVFSLSLPREGHISVYEEKQDKSGFSSLQKLKRTVSGAFCTSQDRITNYRSDNWLLSRSAPNSIDNSQISTNQVTHNPQDKDNLDRPIIIQPSSFGYLAAGKHVMYLPNHPIGESTDFPDPETPDTKSPMSVDSTTPVSSSDHRRKYSSNNKGAHKNDNHHSQPISIPKERESLQDAPANQSAPTKSSTNKGRSHRFTFQSTVRQIERRRIAEKLSKEAEEKEAQRLSELVAMRRVEEEFQRKRAREKASIRHQLRLFSLDENHCASLPIDWQASIGQQKQQQDQHQQQQRPEPDGAVSSPTPSPTSPSGGKMNGSYYEDMDCLDTKTPYMSKIIEEKSGRSYGVGRKGCIQTPVTEVLSEFHTARREYLEYRSDRKCDYTSLQDSPLEHPAIICKIPLKNDQSNFLYDEDRGNIGTNMNGIGGHNYRNEFTRGRSLCSSDSDMSTPSGGQLGDRRQQFRSRSPSPSL